MMKKQPPISTPNARAGCPVTIRTKHCHPSRPSKSGPNAQTDRYSPYPHHIWGVYGDARIRMQPDSGEFSQLLTNPILMS